MKKMVQMKNRKLAAIARFSHFHMMLTPLIRALFLSCLLQTTLLSKQTLLKYERAMFCIEAGLNAERERDVRLAMTDLQVPDRWFAQRDNNVVDDIFYTESICISSGIATGPCSKKESVRIMQFACERKLCQHTVDSIWLFVDIFKEKQLSFRVQLLGRAHQSCDKRQISTNDLSAGFAWHETLNCLSCRVLKRAQRLIC